MSGNGGSSSSGIAAAWRYRRSTLCLPLGDVPSLCDEAARKQILVPAGANFKFRHELARLAAYDRMAPASKREAHGMFLESLMSEGVTEGTVVDISVAVGDTVAVDQTLVEFETDKAVIAIPSPHEGRVVEIKVNVGDSVAIGAVIMLIKATASPADEAPEHTHSPATDDRSSAQVDTQYMGI